MTTQQFDDVTSIVGDGGAGNNVIEVDDDVMISVTLTAGDGQNEIKGGGGGANISAGSGNNFLSADGADDTLTGGAGDDLLQGGAGVDHFVGGSGFTTVSYANSPTAVKVDLSAASPVGQGGYAQGDTYSNIGGFQGSNYGDTFIAGAQGEVFDGGTGDDTLIGGAGNDMLDGGGGADVLTGGGGANTFVFDAHSLASAMQADPQIDEITDYNKSQGDVIDVSQLLAGGALQERIVAGSDGTRRNCRSRSRRQWRRMGDAGETRRRRRRQPGFRQRNRECAASHFVGPGRADFYASPSLADGPVDALWYAQEPAANHRLATLGGDAVSPSPGSLQVGDEFYFVHTDATHGDELWASNGTAAGTGLVMDINPGSAGSNPDDFYAYDGKLVFAADDGVDGEQVWITDGTQAGTQMLTDINPNGLAVPDGYDAPPGIVSYQPPAFSTIDDALYFTAAEPVAIGSGYGAVNHLFQSDGTAAGTSDVFGTTESRTSPGRPRPKSTAIWSSKLTMACTV